MGKVVLLAFTAGLNPTLLGATTVMLLLPKPKRMLLGYLLGAYVTSITLGLVIVFSLHGSSAADTAQNTVSPAVDVTLGLIALLIAYLLQTDRDQRLRERRQRRKEAKKDKGPPKWQQFLGRGSARSAFIVGALLTLPGASYLAGLDRLAGQDLSTVATVLSVLAFNLIMLALLEVPLLSYALAPDTTPARVDALKAGLSRNGRRIGIRLAAVIGVLLVIRGAIEALT
jgi:Sap, sulfolipid-1-addressing protein